MRYVGKRGLAALVADMTSPGRSQTADRILGRRPAAPEPLIRCRAVCGRDLPASEFYLCRSKGRLRRHPWCKECSAAHARVKERLDPALRERKRAKHKEWWRRFKEGGYSDEWRRQAREAIAARAIRVARENPAYGRCVVCGGPVAKRLQRQRKTCSRACLSVVQSRLVKVRRAGGDASSWEKVSGR